MASTLKAPKASSTKHTPAKGKGKALPPAVESSFSEDEDEEESDDEGVDEKGMERLMKALGDDGLDEYEQAQLHVLAGDDDEEWETDGEDEDAGEVGGNQEDDGDDETEASEGEKDMEGPHDDEEEERDIALDDVDDSVDEDAVPRQKIEIDNKVLELTTQLSFS
jgi:rRNA-processing protein EBP2